MLLTNTRRRIKSHISVLRTGLHNNNKEALMSTNSKFYNTILFIAQYMNLIILKVECT
jgi:hypothetical protein